MAKQRRFLEALLAIIGTIGYIGLIIYMFCFNLSKLSPEQSLMIGSMIGIVGAKYSSIYDYFFGSSQGSHDKTDLLKTSERKKDEKNQGIE